MSYGGRVERRYRIDELAKASGVSARTIRYYLQRGLLEAPEFRGPDTRYDERHLLALRAIRALQDAYLPLDAIAERVSGRSVPELAAIASAGGSGSEGGAERRSADEQGVRSNPPPAVLPRPTTVIRYRLAPGVELTVDEDAAGTARAWVERILALAEGER